MAFSRNSPIYNFREIHLGRAELIRADRQTDVAKITIACHTSAWLKVIIKQWETKTTDKSVQGAAIKLPT
jgi:hypothetical protein